MSDRIGEIEARLENATDFSIGMNDSGWPMLYKLVLDIEPKTTDQPLSKRDLMFLGNAKRDLAYLLALVKKYKSALEFYADEHSWRTPAWEDFKDGRMVRCSVENDGGDIAIQALSEDE